jgi:hypothetical protein
LFVGATIGVAGVVLATHLPTTLPQLPLFVLLALASAVASGLKLRLPLGTSASNLSVSYTIDFASLILLGPNPTMLVAALSAWAQTTVRIAKRNPTFRIFFNMAALILTVQAAGWVFLALGGRVGVFDAGLVKPLVGAALAYYLVNTSTVASAVGLSTGQQAWKVWHSNFLWTAPSYFVGAGAAAAAAWAWSTGWGWLVPLAAAPVYLTFRSYTVYLERIAAEQRHHEEMVRLHNQTVEALNAAKQSEQRYGGGRVERRPVGLGSHRRRVLRLRSLEADDRPAGRERIPSRRGLVPQRARRRSHGPPPCPRSASRGRDDALRARVPDVAHGRPRPLDAVPRRRRS